MRRETTDLIGSGLLLAGLVVATIGALAPSSGAGASASSAVSVAAQGGSDRGRALFFVKGCVSCHSKQGVSTTAQVGPDLTGLAARAAGRKPGLDAKAYVHESIKTPSAFIVPGYEGGLGMPDLGLGEDEIGALTDFLLGTP